MKTDKTIKTNDAQTPARHDLYNKIQSASFDLADVAAVVELVMRSETMTGLLEYSSLDDFETVRRAFDHVGRQILEINKQLREAAVELQ